MIPVDDIVEWSNDRQATSARDPLDRVELTARDLYGAAMFYSRTFGFKLSATAPHRMCSFVVLAATRTTALVIRERTQMREVTECSADSRHHCGFVVGDLDWARQVVWDFGIPIARASDDPDQIFRWPNARSLYIRDPDANQIELLELGDRIDERSRAFPPRARTTPPGPVR